MESGGEIKAYKAVFDYKKIGQGHCTFILVNLSKDDYDDPERVGRELAKDPKFESIDICTGEHEMIIKLRTADIDEYYAWIKSRLKRFNFYKTTSLMSLKQMKNEFVTICK